MAAPSTQHEWHEGDEVEMIDNLNGHASHICYGKVVRTTKALVVVLNEHGNLKKFRKSDNFMVGYSWPYLTTAIRVPQPQTTTQGQ